jgi:hypothetical protein
MWQKIKQFWFYAALVVGAVLAYLGFIRKQKVELPERPDKFPGGDKQPKIPDAPKTTDWNVKIGKDLEKIEKNVKKDESNEDLVNRINDKYNGSGENK